MCFICTVSNEWHTESGEEVKRAVYIKIVCEVLLPSVSVEILCANTVSINRYNQTSCHLVVSYLVNAQDISEKNKEELCPHTLMLNITACIIPHLSLPLMHSWLSHSNALMSMSHSYLLSFRAGRGCPYKNVSSCFMEYRIIQFLSIWQP